MVLAALSGVMGAVLFGAAGCLGKLLSDTLYGAIQRYDDGPLPLDVPMWVFAAASSCIVIAIGLQSPPPAQVAILLFAVLSLTVSAATDVRTGSIPDLFTLTPLIVVLAVSAVRREWTPLLGAMFAFVPFAILAVASRGRGMGWGDVKLAALGGALVGMGGMTLAVALAAIAVTVVARIGGCVRRPIAFGPYLAAAIGASLGLANSF
jgi:prepilin signal peptidase PulO-like enzyme (type II secretory pathway)